MIGDCEDFYAGMFKNANNDSDDIDPMNEFIHSMEIGSMLD
jgi:hypothetical protein